MLNRTRGFGTALGIAAATLVFSAGASAVSTSQAALIK
jgi:hypothetical protein